MKEKLKKAKIFFAIAAACAGMASCGEASWSGWDSGAYMLEVGASSGVDTYADPDRSHYSWAKELVAFRRSATELEVRYLQGAEGAKEERRVAYKPLWWRAWYD